MKNIMAVYEISKNTMRKWMGSQRIWIIYGLVLVIEMDFLKPIYQFANKWKFAVSPWVYPFIDSQPFMKMIIFLGVIFIFSDAPFIYQNQIFVISRCGRKRYAVAQLIAVCEMMMIYFLILMCGPMLVYIRETKWFWDWGDVLFTIANTDAMNQFERVGNPIIAASIIENLEPLIAMGLTYLLHVLTGILLGFVVYMGNVYIVRKRGMGILCAVLLVLMDPIMNLFAFQWSPVSWGKLSQIDFLNNGARLSLDEVFFRLVGISLIVAIGCVIKTCSCDIILVSTEES